MKGLKKAEGDDSLEDLEANDSCTSGGSNTSRERR